MKQQYRSKAQQNQSRVEQSTYQAGQFVKHNVKAGLGIVVGAATLGAKSAVHAVRGLARGLWDK